MTSPYQLPLDLIPIQAERTANLPAIRHELYPLHRLLHENPGHPLNPRLDIPIPWERDPLTPALLREASFPPYLHRLLVSLRPLSAAAPLPTPTTSSASHAPITTGRPRVPTAATIRDDERRRRARARNRIGAPTDRPISAEAAAEHLIIMTVIADRRAIGVWAGWAAEAQDYIAQVIPSRRRTLQDYADMRSLVRRRRLSWKLAEHTTDLDDTLDAFE